MKSSGGILISSVTVKIGWAPGFAFTALSKVSNTSALLLLSPITYATGRLSHKSNIALKYTLCTLSKVFPYLNSVTSVTHFSLRCSALNSLLRMFSAINAGLFDALVQPLYRLFKLDRICFFLQIRRILLSLPEYLHRAAACHLTFYIPYLDVFHGIVPASLPIPR